MKLWTITNWKQGSSQTLTVSKDVNSTYRHLMSQCFISQRRLSVSNCQNAMMEKRKKKKLLRRLEEWKWLATSPAQNTPTYTICLKAETLEPFFTSQHVKTWHWHYYSDEVIKERGFTTLTRPHYLGRHAARSFCGLCSPCTSQGSVQRRVIWVLHLLLHRPQPERRRTAGSCCSEHRVSPPAPCTQNKLFKTHPHVNLHSSSASHFNQNLSELNKPHNFRIKHLFYRHHKSNLIILNQF